MRITLLVGTLLLTCSSVSIAGAFKLTHASRANCGNNESISWDALNTHNLAVTSIHYEINGNFKNWARQKNHTIDTKPQYNTHRTAAVHWGESFTANKYYVIGHHWEEKNRYLKIYDHTVTDTTNCNLPNGWW